MIEKSSKLFHPVSFKVSCPLSVHTGESCTMAEYNKLKSMLLDIQSKGLSREEESYGSGMEQKRALVDAMFKYLDLNGDGRLGSEELTQVGMG